MIDVLVAGGGPVGLATALYARRAGLSVAVAEPRSTPIDKACGEGLMPGAVRDLAELGIRPTGRPFRGIRYLDVGHRAEALFASGTGLGVRRTALHSALAEAVAAAGIEVLPTAVRDIRQDDGSVTAAGVTARYLAAADGLHSPIARRLGLDTPPGGGRLPIPGLGARRWGLRRHFAVEPWTDLVEVHWSAHAEAYMTPLSAGLVGVAILSGRHAPFDDQLAGFPALRQRLSGVPGTAARPVSGASDLPEGASRLDAGISGGRDAAEHSDRVLGAGPLRHRTRRRVAGRVLLVGDAAGYVDALTGEGIAVGLACARRLVDCLRTDRPDRYDAQWRQASRTYRMLTTALLQSTRPQLGRRTVVAAAAALPGAFGLIVDRLAG